ncbi:hypothetical protein [Chroococcidiopsis sp. CCALA 051]|nr:hypothetical protein [Chroococcidiopsis sp. CCALA 051]
MSTKPSIKLVVSIASSLEDLTEFPEEQRNDSRELYPSQQW